MQNKLNRNLISKIAEKTGNKQRSIITQIGRKAGKNNTSSETAMINWANELGIKTLSYIKKMAPALQSEIRSSGKKTGYKQESFQPFFVKSNQRKIIWYNKWLVQLIFAFIIGVFGGTLSGVISGYIQKLLGIIK